MLNPALLFRTRPRPPYDASLAAVNAVRNPSGTGAVVGSPGTLPTNWQKNSTTLTTVVAATGTENGIPYVDFRITGTAGGSDQVGLYWETAPGAACLTGQVFSQQVYFKVSGGSSPIGTKCTFQLSCDEFDAAVGYLATDSGTDQEASGPTGTLTAFTQSTTIGNAAARFVVPYIFMFFYGSGAIDFTLRVGSPSLTSTTGNLGSRCTFPWLFNSTNKQLSSESWHYAPFAIADLRVGVVNAYVDTSNNTNTYTELGTGAAATEFFSVRDSGGTDRQFLFGGATSGSCASGGILVSDKLTVAINAGWFRVRRYRTSTAGVLYSTGGNSARGDRLRLAVSGLTNDVMTGSAIADDNPNWSAPPQFLMGTLATATQKSPVFIGTSRTVGVSDTIDASGNLGIIERSINPIAPGIQMGVPGDTMLKFIASHTLRVAIARAMATDVWVEHGVNDGASNEATKEASLATIYGYFLTRRVRGVTVDPNPPSQDFTALNTYIKTLPASIYAVSDVARVVSNLGSPPTWKAGYSADLLHENRTACVAIQSAHAVRFGA